VTMTGIGFLIDQVDRWKDIDPERKKLGRRSLNN